MEIQAKFVKKPGTNKDQVVFANSDIKWDFRIRFKDSFSRVGEKNSAFIKEQQNLIEMDTLIHFIKTHFKYFDNSEPFTYLEIGSYAGESLYYIAQGLPRNSRIAIVDYGDNPYARIILEDVIEYVKNTYGHTVDMLTKNSTDTATRDLVIGKLNSKGRANLCFIDANHTFDFAYLDYKNFGPLSDITLFHDISENHRTAKMETHGVIQATVYHLWKTMKLCYTQYANVGPSPDGSPYFEMVWDEIVDDKTENLKKCGFGIINTSLLYARA